MIFLYKLKQGVCESSFGINVARIAGLPHEVIKKAKVKSEEFERDLKFEEIKAINKSFNSLIGLLENIIWYYLNIQISH